MSCSWNHAYIVVGIDQQKLKIEVQEFSYGSSHALFMLKVFTEINFKNIRNFKSTIILLLLPFLIVMHLSPLLILNCSWRCCEQFPGRRAFKEWLPCSAVRELPCSMVRKEKAKCPAENIWREYPVQQKCIIPAWVFHVWVAPACSSYYHFCKLFHMASGWWHLSNQFLVSIGVKLWIFWSLINFNLLWLF